MPSWHAQEQPYLVPQDPLRTSQLVYRSVQLTTPCICKTWKWTFKVPGQKRGPTVRSSWDNTRCHKGTPTQQAHRYRMWGRLLFEGPQHGTRHMSPFWRLEFCFWSGIYIFGKFVNALTETSRKTHKKNALYNIKLASQGNEKRIDRSTSTNPWRPRYGI